MFGRSKTQAVMDHATTSKDFALALSRDKKFRKQLLSAIGHGAKAKRRAASRVGFTAAAARLAGDKQLKRELQTMIKDLQHAWGRAEKKRSHKLRNTMLVLGGGAAAAGAAIKLRGRMPGANSVNGTGDQHDRRVDRGRRAGLDRLQPVDAVRGVPPLHGGRRRRPAGRRHAPALGRDDRRPHRRVGREDPRAAPDKQISWISEDGKKTRGTVTFEPIGESKTLIRLSMSYQAQGPVEQLGSAAGLDAMRVRGDLGRFKSLIESRGTESGEWRGEIDAGKTENTTKA